LDRDYEFLKALGLLDDKPESIHIVGKTDDDIDEDIDKLLEFLC